MLPLCTVAYARLAGAATLEFTFCLGIGPHPVFDLLLRLFPGDAVLLLNLADQLVILSIDDIDVIIGQFSPTLFHGAFHLFPLALKSIRIHSCLLVGICMRKMRLEPLPISFDPVESVVWRSDFRSVSGKNYTRPFC